MHRSAASRIRSGALLAVIAIGASPLVGATERLNNFYHVVQSGAGGGATDEGERVTRFEGRTVLVTGAASGIGRATAERLLAEGATVVGDRPAGAARRRRPRVRATATGS